MVETIDKTRFEKEKNGVILAVVGASWCPDCQRIEPFLEELSNEYQDVKIFKIDSDAQKELKESLGVERIPTLISYKNNQEVGSRLVEPGKKESIQNAIKSLLA